MGENMLTTSGNTTTSIVQKTPPTTTASTGAASSSNSPVPTTSCLPSLSPAGVIGCHMSNNNTVQNIKCEPHLTPSPPAGGLSAENSNSQRQIDEVAIKNNCVSSETAAHRESSVMQRKNSNSSVISGVSGNGGGIHTSPPSSNNNNDNSNSSNSTTSQIMDADAASSGHQQPQDSNTNSNGKVVNKNSVDDSHEDSVNINSAVSGNFPNACTSKENSSSSTSLSSSSSSSSASVKEDPEIHSALSNLTNVKKEQSTVDTPEMSPDGFGSLPSLSGNNSVVGISSGASSNLSDLLSNTGNGNNSSSNNNNNSKSSISCGMSTSSGSGGTQCLHGDGLSNGQQSMNNNFNGNVSIMPNSMDYMQQQNHIFVFSTQLANKGAESVLNGQFPTIIAYHCTQPATKKFLEDFVLKNPMKMAKIQRQNSLNMAISVSTGHQWIGGGNSMPPKHPQKATGRNNGPASTINNQICNSSMDDKSSTSASSNTGFLEATDSLSGDTELMTWEQSNIALDSIANNSSTSHALKMSDSSENIISSAHNVSVGTSSITQQSPNNPIGMSGSTTPVSPGDMQPSLQGVKVPDENLTPQQRQHREEQLAKLKKMNQFLFPEHGGDLMPDSASMQVPNQLAKINTEGIIGNPPGPGNLVGILGDTSVNSPGIGGVNQLPSRGTTNMIGIGRGSGSMGRNSVNLGSVPPEDGGIPSGIIGGPGDMNNVHCSNQSGIPNNLMINAQQGLPCGPGGILGTIGPNNLSVHGPGQGGMLSHGNMGASGIISINNCGASGASGGIILQGASPKGLSSANQMDIAPPQVEWSKMQHQFYEERTKGNKGSPDIMAGITGLCRSISSAGVSYARSTQPGSGVPASALITGGQVGRSQGPPPPYHPTQRSASVPIATQSPNPSSPNNPTSNLSLPSPRTASGTTLNSPSSDVHVSSSSATTSTSAVATTAAVSNTSKAFQQEDSPTGPNGTNINSGNNNLRNNLNQFNSNPGTPLSNMSPKDLENLGSNGISGDAKNPRPSPQRSRTPHLAGNNNSESTNMDGRFPPASPGIIFPAHMQSQGNGPKISSVPADNLNSGPTSFGRRPDNLPLNPNSSRPPPIKQNHHFDPISSLAQMSQQLTSCVSSNSGVSGPNSVGITNSMSTEMPLGGNQCMEGLIGPGGTIDTGMDHCNNVSGNAGGMGLPPHMLGGGGQYASGGCHMGGQIINPISSRLLAPKIVGSFGAGPGVLRDGPSGFHSGMPPHRMMGRMGINFCPFNGSPNIQVKASTPNTIQYMPVRPQTNNSNPRVPPSLEFLQRFANPQLTGGSNIGDVSMMGSGSGGSSDNKIANNSGNAGMQSAAMNFFQNCNQIGTGTSPGSVSSGNPVDISGGMMPSHADMSGVMNMGGNTPGSMNIRGMRPLRQGAVGSGGSPVGGMHRMQGSGSHIIGGPGGMNQFGNSHETMECVNADPNGIFGNGPGPPNQMFGAQHKSSGMGGQAHCQNMTPTNVGMNGPVSSAGIGGNEQNSPLHGQLNGPGGMLGPNGNGISGPIVSGIGPLTGSIAGSQNSVPGSYKSYMGPSTNDLKYAQQYHNFQQQLYATSTRSQVNQQMGNSPAMGLPGSAMNSGMPTNSNPGFFVNK